ncbi:MAG TPA: extracellular solute-binding protein [Clostridia bacterium]|nr:extracellular solute-binding protein [Clostridia bacterium]
MKRWWTVLLVVALLCAPAAGLAYTADPNLNPPGERPICKETVPLTIGLAENSTIPDMETNGMTLLLEEAGNFDLSFVQYPSAEFATKIDLEVMAGGENLPDVVLVGLDMDVLESYASFGMILDLTEYYENSAYYIPLACQEFDYDILKYTRSEDGRYYSFPAVSASLENETRYRTFLNIAWLDKLGLEVPTTTEAFEDVLRAFQTGDPNGNGVADEMPFMGSKDRVNEQFINYFMTPFVYTINSDNYLFIEDGALAAAYAAEAWREGLRWVAGMIRDGLISPLTFTQDSAQIAAFVASSEQPLLGATVTAIPNLFPNMKDDELFATWAMIGPLAGPDGVRRTPYSPVTPGMNTVITKNCKNPEAAFRLCDLLCSEEFSLMTRFGIQGVDWVTPDEKDKENFVFGALGYEPFMKEVSQWGMPNNNWWGGRGPYIRSARMLGGRVGSTGSNLLYAVGCVGAYEFVDTDLPVGRILYSKEENEFMAMTQTNLLTYARECFARFAVGDMNLDSEWDRYLAELELLGLSEYLGIAQGAYDRLN